MTEREGRVLQTILSIDGNLLAPVSMTRLMKGLDERDKDRGVEQEADSPTPVAA